METPKQTPLEIVTIDPADTMGESYDAHLRQLGEGATAGFLADGRHIDFDPSDHERAYSETDIVRGLIASAGRVYHRRATAGKVYDGRSTRDYPYHRDSKAPSRTPVLRTHYAAEGGREVTFGTGDLPPNYLEQSIQQGLNPDYKYAPVEQSGIEHPGMFSIFAVTGGVIDSQSLLVPAKHLFATVPGVAEVAWARADVNVLPSRLS